MALTPGAKLGPYEVLALIGAGGMGEVYRALDPRLGREVAIKVLPSDRLADEDRRRRFLREARAASALNHPHIVTIYEVESAEGLDFLAMEYVRGKSLDALIPRQGMRLGEALRVAIAVADALASAHAHGIIHRDLKPANVMVGQDGAIKVLDFGLAKWLAGEDDADADPMAPTKTLPALSEPGQRVGTIAYMAPEQAAGSSVDARSDIFTFGAMLYEMVTGHRAFTGKSAADTLAAVLQCRPKPPSEVTANLPQGVERVILRCLRKDAARRFQTMADLKVNLMEIKEESDSGGSSTVVPGRVASRRARYWLAAAALAGLTGVGLVLWLMQHRPVETVSEAPMHVVPLATMRGIAAIPTFSPSGNEVAFHHGDTVGQDGNWGIYVTTIGSDEPKRLSPDHHTDLVEDRAPSWSPDGLHIAFVRVPPANAAPSLIHLMSPFGSGVLKVSDFPVQGLISWSADSTLIVAGRQPTPPLDNDAGIYLIPVGGGNPRRVTRTQYPASDSHPTFSPDGRQIAYASCLGDRCELRMVDVPASSAPAAPPRHIASVRGLDRIAWSRDGRSLIFGTLTGLGIAYIWRVDVNGQHLPQRLDIAGLGAWRPDVSRSGERLAFSRGKYDTDIYRFEPGHGSVPLLVSSFAEYDGQFSPDGRRIAFASVRSGESEIWIGDADGGESHQLTRGPGVGKGSPHWSPDGNTLAFDSDGPDGHSHVWTVDAAGGTPHPLTADTGDQNIPTWSIDGRHVYYSASVDGVHRSIWRVDARGGPAERITQGDSGSIAYECSGGTEVVYQPTLDDGPLVVARLTGGPSREIARCASANSFAVGHLGIYYVGCGGSAPSTLRVVDLKTGRDRVLGALNEYGGGPISVAPDDKAVLYVSSPQSMQWDLMLIENFK